VITLSEILFQARKNNLAIGHFNISNLEQLRGIMEAAKKFNAPIMIGLSEGERKFVGLKQAVAMVKSFKEEYGLPIFLNPDHSHSVESAKDAFDAGFDSVHIDLSKLSFKENIEGTKKVVDYVKSKNPEVSVEGELGYLRGSSALHKEKLEIKPQDLTSLEQAMDFIERTGVDSLAVVIGNAHGVFAAGEEKLHLDRLLEIKKAVGDKVFLVLHGGSGIPAEDVRKAIELGIVKVNVNTELRLAYQEGLAQEIKNQPQETTPYKILAGSFKDVKCVVERKIRLFGSDGKA